MPEICIVQHGALLHRLGMCNIHKRRHKISETTVAIPRDRDVISLATIQRQLSLDSKVRVISLGYTRVYGEKYKLSTEY